MMIKFDLLTSSPIKPRLSWGKTVSLKKTKQNGSSKRKRTVSFSRRKPDTIDSNYELTESLQKELWYRKKDLTAIRQKIAVTIHEAVAATQHHRSRNNNNSTNSNDDGRRHCRRGLESLIADRISPSRQARTHRYEKFAKGLLVLQLWEQAQSQTMIRPEILRAYCRQASSKQQESCARMRAKDDALVAFELHAQTQTTSLRGRRCNQQLPLVLSLPLTTATQKPLSSSSLLLLDTVISVGGPPALPRQVPLCRSASSQRQISASSRAA